MSENISTDPPPEPMITYERGPGWSLEDWALILLGIMSGVLLGISFTNLSEDTGPLANLKIMVLTLSASLAAYTVNKMAVKRGAPLWAIGFRQAGIVSLLGILITSFGLYVGSLSGLIIKDIDTRLLASNGTQLGEYVSAVNAAALDAEKAGPAVQVIADDLTRSGECERRTSCVSGRGYGGTGPMYRAIQGVAGKAETIATAFGKGKTERAALLEELNTHSASYLDTLNDAGFPSGERRSALQGLHGQIAQTAAALAETLPVGLLKSFAANLREGVEIPDDPAGARKLNAILRGHGDALADNLPSARGEEIDFPPFPSRPGMIDVFGFLGEFAALAAVVFVAEVCVPLTLFLYTYLRLYWEIERRKAGARAKPKDNDDPDFDGLIDLPPVEAEEPAEPAAPAKRRPGRPRKAS